MQRNWLAAIIIAATSCITSVADAGITLDRELVGTFNAPMYVTHAPGDSTRLFVIERNGFIRIIKNGSTLPTPFLDISSVVDTTFEGGFLGMAFHPDYDTNGHVYVHYTRSGLVSVIARYTVSGDPDVLDAASAMTLLELPQPAENHNGGWIDFSPVDGYLYIAFGDGGFNGNAQQRAQDITDQLLGKMLRIDVDGDDFPGDALRNYAIPPTNPYVGVTGDDEIWASGLRNPFRCSFDMVTGDLYIGDVGAGSWEEIDFEPAGTTGPTNYGWGCMEGTHCNGSFCTCNGPDLTLPVHEYSHSLGCSVSGGSVYRGCAIPELVGTYFFGDFCSGRIWSFRMVGGNVQDFTDHSADISTGSLVAIGYDADGELYIVSLNGQVYRLTTSPAPPDKNGNGIPDDCEVQLVGDVDGDGDVDTQDLLQMLAAWGPCGASCVEDLDNNGTVGIGDLLMLLSNWTG